MLLGRGVAVSGVSVIGDAQLQATFIIDAGAALGDRDVTATDPTGSNATGVGLLTVTDP